MRVEVLVADDLIERGERILAAMIATAPGNVRIEKTRRYHGEAHTLITYGLGHPVRRPQWLGHVAKGGRVIGWDLGYWNRNTPGDGMMRLSIDADHPQKWIRKENPARWRAAGIALREQCDPDGPIILCGLGWKSKRIFSEGQLRWEFGALERIRAAYPGRRILYRPKRERDPVLPNLPIAHGPIESVLAGASLVVCRHSNVAVDACVAGVPAVCEDGAAAALYGSDVARPVLPTPAERERFLEGLAWWQYRPQEAGLAWAYLRERGFIS